MVRRPARAAGGAARPTTPAHVVTASVHFPNGATVAIDRVEEARRAQHVTPGHGAALGSDDEGELPIIETAAMYNFTNRIASASGMLPNREYHGMGREQ